MSKPELEIFFTVRCFCKPCSETSRQKTEPPKEMNYVAHGTTPDVPRTLAAEYHCPTCNHNLILVLQPRDAAGNPFVMEAEPPAPKPEEKPDSVHRKTKARRRRPVDDEGLSGLVH